MYLAVIESTSTGRLFVVKVAMPFSSRIAVPISLAPFLNLTFPVGGGPFWVETVVAVKVAAPSLRRGSWPRPDPDGHPRSNPPPQPKWYTTRPSCSALPSQSLPVSSTVRSAEHTSELQSLSNLAC